MSVWTMDNTGVAGCATPGGQVPVGVHRHQLGDRGEAFPGQLDGSCGFSWPLAPSVVPVGVVLHVDEDAFNRPGEFLAQGLRIAASPVRPVAAADRQANAEEAAVVVGELESVLQLDPIELGGGQTGLDVSASPDQTASCFLAQGRTR
jgi:hypothetical protein